MIRFPKEIKDGITDKVTQPSAGAVKSCLLNNANESPFKKC